MGTLWDLLKVSLNPQMSYAIGAKIEVSSYILCDTEGSTKW